MNPWSCGCWCDIFGLLAAKSREIKISCFDLRGSIILLSFVFCHKFDELISVYNSNVVFDSSRLRCSDGVSLRYNYILDYLFHCLLRFWDFSVPDTKNISPLFFWIIILWSLMYRCLFYTFVCINGVWFCTKFCLIVYMFLLLPRVSMSDWTMNISLI